MGKVVVVTSSHRHVDGRIFHKEARTLASAGYDVVLLAPWGRDELVDGVRLRPLPAPRSRPHRFTIGGWRAYRQAAAEGGAVYHLHDPELLLWAPLLRRRGALVIFDMHEHTRSDLLTATWLPAFQRAVAWAYGRLERLLIGASPVIFAESSYARDYRWVTTSTEILNMPMVDTIAAAGSPSQPEVPTMVYLGSVTRLRGSATMLRAAAELARRGRSARWELVGPVTTDHRHELEALAGELGVADLVRIRGFLPQREAWRLAAGCSAGLAVMEPAPGLVDSYPTKLFEYMALGLPVIASDFPLWRSVVEPTGCGLLVADGSPGTLADVVESLLDDPAEASGMAERGRQATQQRYRWETEADKLLRFYHSVAPNLRGAT